MKSLNRGRGAEVVFECAGQPAAIQEACSLAAAGATVIVLSICYQPVEIDFLSLVTREINIKTAFGKTGAEFKEAVRLIEQGMPELNLLISGLIPLSSVEEGFLNPGAGNIKILVDLVS